VNTATGLEALRNAGFRLDADSGTLARYSSDASLNRVVPAAVARPDSVAELSALVDAAREAQVAVTSRGAGTSIAGNAVGEGLIIDCRNLTSIAHLDPRHGAAIVEPGVVPAVLTAAAAPHRLRFGPDPSTVDRCTIGGMIGNNACGARALGYGRTADNLLGVSAITGTGERLTVAARTEADAIAASPTLSALHRLVEGHLGVIRTEFGRFSRQVSGYGLEHLLPENDFNVAAFLAGSEGTLAVITGARVRLVAEPAHTALVALGYPDMVAAAAAMPQVLAFSPTAAEGLDRRIIDVIGRRHGSSAVPRLPTGGGWLLVELADDDPEHLARRAQELVSRAGCLSGEVVEDPVRARRLWQIRADGAGLAAIGLAKPAHSGWEDTAVPPSELAGYLRELEALMASHGLQGLPYGHFGEGCVHVRIDFELSSPRGVAGYRDFVEQAADLVVAHGGSISGEHGDGRARSELLSRMYSPAALALFAEVKHIFDPNNLLNPGVLVDPRPLDADLRLAFPLNTSLRGLDADFAAKVHRCTGVAACLTSTGVMCPSYQATGQEQDSTRGRARILQELTNGTLIGDWGDAAVSEALELCLSCKACSSECPTGTDIAAAKSRVLDERYRGRLRPRSHYSLGGLPGWARLVTSFPGLPGLANAILAAPGLGRLGKALAGVDARRSLPRFSARPAHRRRVGPATGRPVVVWIDPFTDYLDAGRLDALLKVLAEAGYAPRVLRRHLDSGVSLITTGQRDRAARVLRAALDVLQPIAAQGMPIVGMEPSSLAVWRSDAAELLDDPRLAEVSSAVRTLAEVLTDADQWTPPQLTGLTVVAQPHCHQRAVLGWQADAALLARTGATIITVDGCCGMAGNFGVELGHYDVSRAVADHDLLPAIDAAGPDAVLLADGFSCRYQVQDLIGRRAVTLAELLTGAATPPVQ
jgi:FAD/FMN-containing dehydrogenase/Fe-S oxidoreductase